MRLQDVFRIGDLVKANAIVTSAVIPITDYHDVKSSLLAEPPEVKESYARHLTWCAERQVRLENVAYAPKWRVLVVSQELVKGMYLGFVVKYIGSLSFSHTSYGEDGPEHEQGGIEIAQRVSLAVVQPWDTRGRWRKPIYVAPDDLARWTTTVTEEVTPGVMEEAQSGVWILK